MRIAGNDAAQCQAVKKSISPKLNFGFQNSQKGQKRQSGAKNTNESSDKIKI